MSRFAMDYAYRCHCHCYEQSGCHLDADRPGTDDSVSLASFPNDSGMKIDGDDREY